MKLLQGKLTYANVIATLALFIALGGASAFAATQLAKNSVGAKQLKNGAVTTAKIAKSTRAALVGSKGPKGEQGPPGERGPAGPVDPGQFVPTTGLYEVVVGPGGWQSVNPNLKRSNVFGTWASTGTDDSSTLFLDPPLPAQLAGKGMRLRAVTPCWNATTGVMISDVIISTFRETATAATTDVVEQEDVNDYTNAICKRYEFTTPVDMSGGRRVSIRMQASWALNGATIHIGGATFEFDRAP
jgi:hypothetical protein